MRIDQANKLMSKLLESGFEDTDFPVIEGYLIIEQIGAGGAGTVYEGVVVATGRSVAIKIYHTKVSNPASHSIHELELLAHVRSPVVPHVFDHGWVDNQVYIVTEFIDGDRLLDYAEGLGLEDRVKLLAQICDAVGVLNERGIIHRDIKPSNIMITKQGTPVLIDLGIAELMETHGRQVRDPSGISTPTGTLDYMCPEQARGENDAITTRWDVYGLGAIGYVLLTGSTPHDLSGSVQDRLKQLATQLVREPRDIDPKLPKQLASVLLKACSYEPTARYESAQHLRDDLTRWVNGEHVLAGEQGLWTRMTRSMARHPYLSVASVSSLIVICIFGVSAIVFWYQSMVPYRFASQDRRETNIAELVSRSGLALRSWETDESKGIRYGGDVFETPDGRFAVIGLEVPDIHSGQVGLLGYKLGDYQEPAWKAEQTVPELMAYSIRKEPGPHNFRFRKILIEDIFPERVGREIISIHHHSLYSLTAVQVHTPSGELLCDYYHDGWPVSMYWNPRYRQLVLAGQNSDGTSLHRGADELWVGKYPVVVFAIELNIGEFRKSIMHPGLDLGAQGYKPLWYKCLLPGEEYPHVQSETNDVVMSVHAPGLARHRSDGYTAIQFGGMGNRLFDHVTFLVDESGVEQDRVVTDSWRASTGIDPFTFYLGELPERTVPRLYWP